VSEQVEVGQRLTARLREERVPVTIAFWNQPDEGGRWTLCIATPIADRDGPLAAYREVFRVKDVVDPEFILGASDVTVIGDTHPIVQDLLNLQKQYPTRLPAGGKPLVVTGVVLSNPFPHPLSLSPSGTVLGG
jgi:hypothetical protein